MEKNCYILTEAKTPLWHILSSLSYISIEKKKPQFIATATTITTSKHL